MNNKNRISETVLKRMVKEGKGIYRGIQYLEDNVPYGIFFDCPVTHSSILIPLNEMSIENVKYEIARKQKEFKECALSSKLGCNL